MLSLSIGRDSYANERSRMMIVVPGESSPVFPPFSCTSSTSLLLLFPIPFPPGEARKWMIFL